mgnify:FL=1
MGQLVSHDENKIASTGRIKSFSFQTNLEDFYNESVHGSVDHKILASEGATNYSRNSDIIGQGQMRTGNGFEGAGELSEYYINHIAKRKYQSITEEAKRNNPQTPLWLGQPFINRGPANGKPGVNVEETVITSPVLNTVRDAMFLGSPKGLLFLAKQVGYQLTNPKGEFYDPTGTISNPLHSNRIFNPLAMVGAPVGNMVGAHLMRHGAGPFNALDSDYEHRIIKLNQSQGDDIGKSQNRLIKLAKEAGYSHFKTGGQNTVDGMPEGGKKGFGLSKLKELGKKLASKLARGRTPWVTLSGLGGPNSLLGIGSTTQYRHGSGNPLQHDFSFWSAESPYSKKSAAYTISSAVREGESNIVFHLGNLDAESTDDMVIFHPANDTEQLDELASSDSIEKFKPALGPGRGNTRQGIHSYKAFEYGDLPQEAPVGTNNFLETLGPDETKGRFVADYEANNIIKRWGLGNYGRLDKTQEADDAFVNNDEFNDCILFKLAGIQFRAIFDGDISDNTSIGWNSHKYIGRDTELYTYDKYSRSFTFKVMIPSFTANEAKKNYQKVNQLMRNCRAVYDDDDIPTSPYNTITLGAYWVSKPCLIESINNTVATHDWDIAFGEGRQTVGSEIPKHFSLDISGKFLSVPSQGEANYFGSSILQ